ncbi:MAG: hypothetical protein MO852_10925 [Candidatus Devosia euplotis]|nr:hypothetical protein [Candidatus Devosia euplotis]
MGGAGLIFLVQALIARIWGPELLGEYLIVIATVNLIAVWMPLGFHTVGTYFAAEYRARGERQQFWCSSSSPTPMSRRRWYCCCWPAAAGPAGAG